MNLVSNMSWPFFVFIIVISFLCLYLVFKNHNQMLSVFPFRNTSIWKLRTVMYMISILLILLAFFRIEFSGDKVNIGNDEKGDAYFLLDFTASMRVRDENGLSRIESAVDKILLSVDKLNISRVGLSVFSERNYRLIPLTKENVFVGE